jgi:hypothetical protein
LGGGTATITATKIDVPSSIQVQDTISAGNGLEVVLAFSIVLDDPFSERFIFRDVKKQQYQFIHLRILSQ